MAGSSSQNVKENPPMHPELDRLPPFDTIIAGISGGKDSTALALWLVFESGIPPQNQPGVLRYKQ